MKKASKIITGFNKGEYKALIKDDRSEITDYFFRTVYNMTDSETLGRDFLLSGHPASPGPGIAGAAGGCAAWYAPPALGIRDFPAGDRHSAFVPPENLPPAPRSIQRAGSPQVWGECGS